MKKWLWILLIPSICFASSIQFFHSRIVRNKCDGDIITLEWDAAVCDGDCTNGVDGYKVYWGSSSVLYQHARNVGDVLTTEICIPLNYYIAVTAYNIDGESQYSSEVQYTGE